MDARSLSLGHLDAAHPRWLTNFCKLRRWAAMVVHHFAAGFSIVPNAGGVGCHRFSSRLGCALPEPVSYTHLRAHETGAYL
eukprot:7981701-Pyramimonas_sp.AAC.1